MAIMKGRGLGGDCRHTKTVRQRQRSSRQKPLLLGGDGRGDRLNRPGIGREPHRHTPLDRPQKQLHKLIDNLGHFAGREE